MLVGIDCAAQTPKIGVALGYLDAGSISVESVAVGRPDPSSDIVSFIEADLPVVIAIDAPLGWPHPLSESLIKHNAGDSIETIPNELFRRETDRVVRETIGKQSLDIGADKIARVAWSALSIIGQIRAQAKREISVVTHAADANDCRCIEVYPAATLEARGFSSKGYKGNKPEHKQCRIDLEARLRDKINYDDAVRLQMIGSDDAIDSVICLLAAKDYIFGKTILPTNHELALKEGWIWVRQPD